MEYKIGEYTINDTKKYGLFGQSIMVVSLNKGNDCSLVLGQSNRLSAFIRYLINEWQKSVLKGIENEDISEYNILHLLFDEIVLNFGNISSEHSAEYIDYILNYQIPENNKKVRYTKKQEKEDLEHSAILSKAMTLGTIQPRRKWQKKTK